MPLYCRPGGARCVDATPIPILSFLALSWHPSSAPPQPQAGGTRLHTTAGNRQYPPAKLLRPLIVCPPPSFPPPCVALDQPSCPHKCGGRYPPHNSLRYIPHNARWCAAAGPCLAAMNDFPFVMHVSMGCTGCRQSPTGHGCFCRGLRESCNALCGSCPLRGTTWESRVFTSGGRGGR